MQKTRVRSLGREDPLEKEMATHSSILAWKIPWMEDPGRLQSMGLQRVGHNWVTSLSLSWCVLSCFSCVWLCATPWTVSHQSPLSMGFSRQKKKNRNGLPCPSPGDLPNPRIKPVSLTSSLLASELFTTSAIWEAPMGPNFIIIYLVEYQWVMLDRHGVWEQQYSFW